MKGERRRREVNDEQLPPPLAIRGSDFGDFVRKSAYFIEATRGEKGSAFVGEEREGSLSNSQRSEQRYSSN